MSHTLGHFSPAFPDPFPPILCVKNAAALRIHTREVAPFRGPRVSNHTCAVRQACCVTISTRCSLPLDVYSSVVTAIPRGPCLARSQHPMSDTGDEMEYIPMGKFGSFMVTERQSGKAAQVDSEKQEARSEKQEARSRSFVRSFVLFVSFVFTIHQRQWRSGAVSAGWAGRC